MMKKKYFIENQEIECELKKVKKEIYLSMNGVCSEEMDQKGLDYMQNYGVRFIRIKELALKHVQNSELSERLWYQNIRETQLLALLLMPIESFNLEKASEWNSRIVNTELAEIASFYLFSKMEDALEYVNCFINSQKEYIQQTALLVASKCAPTSSFEMASIWIDFLLKSTSFSNLLVARAASIAVANLIRKHFSLINKVKERIESMPVTLDEKVVYFRNEILEEIEYMR